MLCSLPGSHCPSNQRIGEHYQSRRAAASSLVEARGVVAVPRPSRARHRIVPAAPLHDARASFYSPPGHRSRCRSMQASRCPRTSADSAAMTKLAGSYTARALPPTPRSPRQQPGRANLQKRHPAYSDRRRRQNAECQDTLHKPRDVQLGARPRAGCHQAQAYERSRQLSHATTSPAHCQQRMPIASTRGQIDLICRYPRVIADA